MTRRKLIRTVTAVVGEVAVFAVVAAVAVVASVAAAVVVVGPEAVVVPTVVAVALLSVGLVCFAVNQKKNF